MFQITKYKMQNTVGSVQLYTEYQNDHNAPILEANEIKIDNKHN